jgi:hypothetical protein
MKKTIIAVLTALVLVGCDTGGSIIDPKTVDENETDKPVEKPDTPVPSVEKYAKELWGEWLRMDTGDKWYISDNVVKINNTVSSKTVSLDKQSERVIKVTDGGREYYLYASRIANARFTGSIAGSTGETRAVVGNVRISIANTGNKSDTSNVITNTEGVFTAEGIIPGDAYIVTPEGGAPVTVIPANDGADVGVVTITGGVNFKTSISPVQASVDMNELYINETYSLNLEFENVGDEDCPAPSYTIIVPAGVTITGNMRGILGTIEPGVKKSVPISVICTAEDNDYEYKKINVTIRDGTGKMWEDSVSLRFYKDTIDFNIKAEESISGIVITPDMKTYSFTDVTNGTVTVPRRSMGDYLVVFSGATIDTETCYALGVGTEADEDFETFTETSRYEPNNTEGETVSLGEQRIMAFLHSKDIDYYRVSYSDIPFPSTPTNVTSSVKAVEITVSWDEVPDASSYNIYRSDDQEKTYTKIGTTAPPSYIDTVDDEGTYYYRVIAVNADDFESAHSASTSAIVTRPSVPTNVTTSVTDAEVTLSWNVVSGASSYNVYRSDSQTGTYTKIGESVSLSYMDTVDVARVYYYKVSTVDVDGFESAHSTPRSVTVTIPMEFEVTTLTDMLSWLSENAISSGHYTLLLEKDETISAQTLSYSGKTITIILKGKGGERAVNLSSNGSLFTVRNGVTLVLDDGITLKGHSSNNASLVNINSGGTLLLKDGAKITGNTATSSYAYGGGVYNGGMFEMSGGEISGNTVSSSSYAYGGGVYVSGGTFEMSGGEISGNTVSSSSYASYAYGGGVCFGSSGTFTMSGGEISGNTASSSSSSSAYGGGVYFGSSGTFEMSGGEISGNSGGGGVYVDGRYVADGGTFKMSGGEISGNSGGGVYFGSSGTFTMSSGKISGNSGGGVSNSGTFTMSGGTISGNSGGVSNSGTFTMSSGKISGNFGSGVSVWAYLSSGTFTMSGGEISGNSGGGVYVEEGRFTMSGGTISGNTSEVGGGVCVSGGTFTKQSGGTIYGSDASALLKNTASSDSYGHAVYIYDDSRNKKRNTTAGVGVTLNSGSSSGWE